MNKSFSFFHHPISNNTPSGVLGLDEMYEYIVSDKAKEATDALRGITDKEARRAYKGKAFDYCTVSARVSKRAAGGEVWHSGLFCMDIDDLSEEKLQEVKSALIADSEMPPSLIFRSPSGNGLKVIYNGGEEICRVMDNSNGREEINRKHKCYYNALRELLRARHEIESDATCDVTRACYLCHDGDAYYNADAEIQSTEYRVQSTDNRLQSTDNRDVGTHTSCVRYEGTVEDDYTRVERLVRRIEATRTDITGTNAEWFQCGCALAGAFGEMGRGFYHRISQFYPTYEHRETDKKYTHCLNYSRYSLGTLFHIAKKNNITL